jgi:hypothetical protein
MSFLNWLRVSRIRWRSEGAFAGRDWTGLKGRSFSETRDKREAVSLFARRLLPRADAAASTRFFDAVNLRPDVRATVAEFVAPVELT